MSELTLQVHTCPGHTMRDGRSTFSPTTATLILGEQEAVLVDTLYLPDDVDALGDAIESSGRRLTAIFVTHGHYDHYYGLPRLMARFPQARAVAAAEVARYIASTVESDAEAFGQFFAELSVAPTVLPAALDCDVIEIEGHELRVIHVGQADITPSTSLHIPDLDAVVAGDVIYNGIHQMLAFGGPDQWQDWIASVETLAALHPKVIVAGHKQPEAPDDAAKRMLDDTRRYIEDFAQAAKASSSAREIVVAMSEKWPDHGNPATLMASAGAAAQMAQRTP